MKQKKNIFYRIAESPLFQRFIIGIIITSSILIGVETYHGVYASHYKLFHAADILIQAIFTVEIIIRILALGKKPLHFFKTSNNIIDFVITAIFYLPFGGPFASVFRLIRIIRIFRLITALPKLQILVGALLKSIPSMGYITLLLLIQMYIFAVIGTFLFSKTDPAHFGNVGSAILTLFQIITLEGWVEIMELQKQPVIAPIYFISFILLGTMIVLNLFIGVIINGFDEVKKEIEQELAPKKKRSVVEQELMQVSEQLDTLKQKLDTLIIQKKKSKTSR